MVQRAVAISLLLWLCSGQETDRNETSVRRLRGYHRDWQSRRSDNELYHGYAANDFNMVDRLIMSDDFFEFDNWHQTLSSSEKGDYINAFKDEYSFFQDLINEATRRQVKQEDAYDYGLSDALQGYFDELMMDGPGGVGSDVPAEVGQAIQSEVMALKKEIKKLEGELTPQIIAACSASGLANGADPFPIPAISAAADIGITLTLSKTMGDKFKQGLASYDLGKRVADRLKKPALKVWLTKTAAGKTTDAAIEAFKAKMTAIMARVGTKISQKVAEMATVKWIRSFFAKKAGQVAATSQLKWMPIVGQLAAGSISSVFMKYSAQDIRRMYSNLYFDNLRAAIYESFSQPVPKVNLRIERKGWAPGFKVWTLIATNSVTGKEVVRIDRDYGKTGNLQKAKDFYTEVEKKGFLLDSSQCEEIASKLNIWDHDWYKNLEIWK